MFGIVVYVTPGDLAVYAMIRAMKPARSQLSRSIRPWRRRTKPVVTPEYIVGLTDGEGCFYVNVRSSPMSAKGWVETHFYIKVRIEDQPMLEKVKSVMGCGAIYFQKENRPNHTACCRYEVNSRKDIREYVIPLFDSYPLQSIKQKDFLIFKQISEMLDRNEHQTEAGYVTICELKRQMNYRTRRVRESRSLGGNSEQL